MPRPETYLEEIRSRIEAAGGFQPPAPAKSDAELEAERWAWLAPRIGVPIRYQGVIFRPGLQATWAADTALTWCQGSGPSPSLASGGCLVLAGPTGTGKTWAAVAALRYARSHDREFAYFPGACAAMLRDGNEELATLKMTRFLVIDDFGVEYVKDGGYLQSAIDAIFWYREANYMPTIVTTNLTPDELKERLSSRIKDRLRGWAQIYLCTGESKRGK